MDYKACYDRLIYRAQWRMVDKCVYVEKHHIVPKCLGGKDNCLNLVKLLPEEHYLAHQLLVKIYPKNYSLVHAANLMTGRALNNKRNNKSYGWIRRKVSLSRKDRKLSEETKAKIGKASSKPERLTFLRIVHSKNKGAVRSKESKARMSAGQTGRKHRKECLKKLYEIGVVLYNNLKERFI